MVCGAWEPVRRLRPERGLMAARISRVKVDCPHGGKHKHGTRSAYRMDGCGCQPCRQADRRATTMRELNKLAGRPIFVPADRCRDHITALRAAGMGEKPIAAAAGVALATVQAIVRGKPRRPPQERVSRDVERRILAVSLQLLDGCLVDGTGTRRRIQALVRHGWSMAALGRELGFVGHSAPVQAWSWCHSELVHKVTAERVAALYDRLWNVAPPATTRAEKCSVTASKNRAIRYGWAPALAWDDETITDPKAKPCIGASRDKALDEIAIAEAMQGRKVQLTRAERAEVVRRMTETGWSARRIAERMHTTPRSVTRNRSAA